MPRRPSSESAVLGRGLRSGSAGRRRFSDRELLARGDRRRGAARFLPATFLLLLASATPHPARAEFGPRWLWTPQPASYFDRHFDVGDFDGVPGAELAAVSCGGGCWFLLGRGGSGHQVVRASLPLRPITLLRAARTGSSISVFVEREDERQIEVYDAAEPWYPDRIFPGPSVEMNDLAVVDLDRDGAEELIVLDEFDLRVLDLASGAVEQVRLGFGGFDVAIGQADDDPQVELGIASGLEGAGWVLDGESLEVEAGATTGFGRRITFVDLEGDGLQEVATFERHPSYVRAFDPHTNSWIFELDDGELPGLPSSVSAFDADGDGDEELAVGHESSQGILVLDGSEGSILTTLQGPFGEFAVSAADTDGDGRGEILTLGQYVRFLDPLDGSLLETWGGPSAPFGAPEAGEADGGGMRDLVLSSGQRPYPLGGGAIHLLRGADGWLIRTWEPEFADGWPYDDSIEATATLQADGDPALETCVSSDSTLLCVDDSTGLEEWRLDLGAGQQCAALLAGDLRPDEAMELLVSHASKSEGGAYLRALFGATGSSIWTSPDVRPYVWWPSPMGTGELDGAGYDEIVLGASGGPGMVLVDGEAGAIEGTAGSPVISVLTVADVDVDGQADVVAGDDEGTVGVLDLTNGGWDRILLSLAGPVSGVAVAELLDSSPGPELAVVSDRRISIHEPSSGAVLWQTQQLGEVGSRSFAAALSAKDVDGDGSDELIALFEGVLVLGNAYSGEILFIDGFEPGSSVGWSSARPSYQP